MMLYTRQYPASAERWLGILLRISASPTISLLPAAKYLKGVMNDYKSSIVQPEGIPDALLVVQPVIDAAFLKVPVLDTPSSQ